MSEKFSIVDYCAPSKPVGKKPLDLLARNVLLKKLKGITVGSLEIIDGELNNRFGDTLQTRSIKIVVHDRRFYSDVVFGGTAGAGESYISGAWSCSDLTGLVKLFIRNRHVLGQVDSGWYWLTEPLRRWLHKYHRNSRNGAQRNIVAHYDIGNDLFSTFLDHNMMYSCAYFEKPEQTLDEASDAKLRRICEKLKLGPQDHVLEIGSGWGGFALFAARNYGCRVTTTTISQAQFKLACERVAEAGLQHRVRVLKQDFRDLEGKYDKLVSVEMIEAIGYENYQAFFRQCDRLLVPQGVMLLQTITIRDQLFHRARKEVDFIKRFIFPGSCIPSVEAVLQAMTAASQLRLFHHEDIGPFYAETLRRWRRNFFRLLPRVKAMGYNDAFIRMWDFYLCYCEGGFEERTISDVQMLLVKPENRFIPVNI